MTIDYLQLRLNTLIHYQLPAREPLHRKAPDLTKKAYSGNVGINAAKRLRRAIEIMAIKWPKRQVYSHALKKNVTFWLSFVTLTIPAHTLVSHREAIKTLALWLLQIKRKYGIWYVWKAELQARGQIHFHVCMNQFIEWREIRERWNKLMKKNGWSAEYYAAHGHYNANSTDVKHVRESHQIGAYLAKYVAKNGGKIDGKVWDCSLELKGKKYYSTEMVAYNYQEIERQQLRVVKLETCSVINSTTPESVLTQSQRSDRKQNW